MIGYCRRYVLSARHCLANKPLYFHNQHPYDIPGVLAESYSQALALANLVVYDSRFDQVLIEKQSFHVAIVRGRECVKPVELSPGSRRDYYFIGTYQQASNPHYPNAWVLIKEAEQFLQLTRPDGYLADLVLA